jgi:hypothetical protein
MFSTGRVAHAAPIAKTSGSRGKSLSHPERGNQAAGQIRFFEAGWFGEEGAQGAAWMPGPRPLDERSPMTDARPLLRCILRFDPQSTSRRRPRGPRFVRQR